MSEEYTFDYKHFNIIKILAPVLKSLDLEDENLLADTFLSIRKGVDDIAGEIFKISDIDKDNSVYVYRSLYETISELTVNNIIINGDRNIKPLMQDIKNFIGGAKDVAFDAEATTDSKIKVLYAIFRVMNEAYHFHNSLYFSNKISSTELKGLNDGVLVSAVRSIMGTMYFIDKSLENQKINDKVKVDTIYESMKIAGVVYSDTLSSLTETLTRDDAQMRRYIKKQDFYLDKVNRLYVENFSKINIGCKKLMSML